ncbi:hypothetical protein BGZ82_006832 [Podila clonocystis]|nr:hypothetical protein BGZ82_006832 [Podila clonocystis]
METTTTYSTDGDNTYSSITEFDVKEWDRVFNEFERNLLDAELEGQIQYEADLAAKIEEEISLFQSALKLLFTAIHTKQKEKAHEPPMSTTLVLLRALKENGDAGPGRPHMNGDLARSAKTR